MKLTVLGTGTVSPSPVRTSAAHLVEAGDVRLLLDCGAGTLHRLAQAGAAWQEITHLALTHFHVDHWGELAAFIFAQKWGAPTPRSLPLTLIGPVGLTSRLEHLARGLGDWLLAPGFDLELVELAPPAGVQLAPDVELGCCATAHTDESVAYAVTADGRRLVYTGDTGPNDALADWADGCDLLLVECSLPDESDIGIHLTPHTVSELVRRASPARVVLTHLYPVVPEAQALATVRETGVDAVVAADGEVFDLGVA
ncbi:MAG: MBL fold metallo-hydrolase [Gemmatimonadales bacterium]